MKLSSINTIHVKQEHNFGFFIFKFTLKYMLSNVYINKIHARQCLYITRNPTRYNNRDDLLQLSFTLKVSIFGVAYI